MPRYEGWKARAACRDHPNPDEVFFPHNEKGKRTDISQAQAICFDCPVRKTCLVYAVVYREARGVWGGMSESDRKQISRPTRLRWRQVWYHVYPNSREHEIFLGKEVKNG